VVRKTPWLLLLTPVLVLSDEVYLRNAGVLTGRIVEQTEEIVKVDVGEGIIGVPMSHVDRIVKGRSALDEYDERAGRLGPGDASGWRSLGRWADQQGLSKQSREAYEKVLAAAPNDAEARQALGFVQLGGRWVTEEESYEARGYVKYEGEWMTPAEAQLAQQSAAAYVAQHEAEQRAVEAEIAAQEAEARAQDAEARAQEAEDEAYSYGYGSYPVYWGGWGYGVGYWPSNSRPARPATLPSGGRR
jgi:hypothetical protein